jgi:long-subunit fatty acid transport protein
MFGFMYRYEDIARFGLTIKTPTSMTVHETYANSGQSAFDDTTGYYYGYNANNDYGLTTPWVFGFGASYSPFEGLLLSGQLEYTDWTQLQWTDNSALESENISLDQELRSTLNYAVGGEFEIPRTDFRVRAGYSFKPSAYVGDPSSFGQTTITAGAGVLLQDNVMVDVAAMFGSFKTYHNNYVDPTITDPSRTDESISTTNIDLTISYRF